MIYCSHRKIEYIAHITEEQRYTISCIHAQGYKQQEIALAIRKDMAVVSKEMKRNREKGNGIYRHDLAQFLFLYIKNVRFKIKLTDIHFINFRILPFSFFFIKIIRSKDETLFIRLFVFD